MKLQHPCRNGNREPGGRKEALLIGCTGMLMGIIPALSGSGWKLTITGRKSVNLSEFPDARLLLSDYRDPDQFLRDVSGSYRLVVCWMHITGRETMERLFAAPGIGFAGACFLHVKGSSSWPGSLSDPWKTGPWNEFPGYCEVLLGCKTEKGQQRWLTDNEICSGVLNAISQGAKHSVIGTTGG